MDNIIHLIILRGYEKKLLAMIKQLGLPTIFVTFTFVERLWDPLIKILYTLHASTLNFSNKIYDLQYVRIVELIPNDFVT